MKRTRQDSDFFEHRELDLIYIAKRRKEALRLESALTESGVDYAGGSRPVPRRVIFRTEPVGAFFYVSPEAAERARDVVGKHGLRFNL